MQICITSPTRTITAARLFEMVKDEAILSPLITQWDTAAHAYRVDAYAGPYLMLTDEVSRYRERCRSLYPSPV